MKAYFSKHGFLMPVAVILFLILFLPLFLTGCDQIPQAVEQTSNQDISVGLMLEKDGCKVYRFYDSTRPVYFTTCQGKTQWEQVCGKNCRRPVVNDTELK